MAELTVPQIDFSGIGQLPQIWKQAQNDQLRQQTLANLGQGGTADATALLKSGDLSLAQLGINMRNHQEELAHQAARDAVSDRHWSITDKRAAGAEGRAQYEFDHTPDQYAPNPKFGQPGEPQYIDVYAAAKTGTGAQPDDMVMYNAARQQGYTGSLMDFIKEKKAPLVNIDQKTEGEQSKALGKALGEAQGEDIKTGLHASQTMRQLATLDNANKAGGDDISSGPFGELVLKGKQGLNEIAGEDLTNAAPSEVIKKVGFGLATNLTKAITNRPAQAEFMKALENVPNLMMSKTGRQAMTSIMMQEKRAEQEIGRLAARHRDVVNGPVWQDIKDKYYEEHPLISPFTGKPFSPEDVSNVIKSAPGGTGATTVAPGGVTRADVEAEIRRRQAQPQQ